jgi:prefoldin subunit 5
MRKTKTLDELYAEIGYIEEEIDDLNNLLMNAIQDRNENQHKIDVLEGTVSDDGGS